MTLLVRPAAPEDTDLLSDMLVLAADWRGRGLLDHGDLPCELARYLSEWPREGDVGVVAEIDGTPVGAAWLRRFTVEEQGYGFVDDATPELSVAVIPDHRGSGVGRALLEAVLVAARARGIRQVSLSVEPDNPAERLYRSVGFVEVATSGGAITMVASTDQYS